MLRATVTFPLFAVYGTQQTVILLRHLIQVRTAVIWAKAPQSQVDSNLVNPSSAGFRRLLWFTQRLLWKFQLHRTQPRAPRLLHTKSILINFFLLICLPPLNLVKCHTHTTWWFL